jgi:hypothetical protein
MEDDQNPAVNDTILKEVDYGLFSQEAKQKGRDRMFAIAFDLKIDDLKKTYGEPYNGAYDEIRQELEHLGFEWTQGSVYINRTSDNSLTAV